MKYMKFKNRLFLVFCAMLAIAVVLPGIYFYNALKSEILEESRENALEQLEFLEWSLTKDAPFDNSEELDRWCTAMADKLGYRITVIKPNGKVIADSSVPYKEVKYIRNHSKRPEILETADSGEPAVSMRYSDTIRRNLIYAAKQIRHPEKEETLYLRAAYPVSSVEIRLNAYTRRFWAGMALVAAIAFFASLYLARMLEKPIHRVMDRFKAIASGDFAHHYIMDEGREFYELSVTLNETADRIREQMEVISEQNTEMEAIIENMREGVMLIDRSGRIKTINRAMGDIAECRLSCIGKRPLEVLLNSEVQDACDRILNGAKEYSLTVSAEDERYYEVYALRVPEGGALIVFYDISAHRQLEKIRRDFVANVSHELKTPLTSIRGYVETLASGDFSIDEQAESFLLTIRKNAEQMTHIVNDLLELTRLEERPAALTPVPLDAAGVFQSAIETCMPMADEKQVKIKNRIARPVMVKADEAALTRVVKNLVDNAVRYSPAGAAVELFCESGDREIIFGIRDQGPGIADPHKDRIFERFYRIDKERSRATGGTGLGLSICKHAVSAMKGRIWVKSPPDDSDSGSIFFFALPRAGGEKNDISATGNNP
ncbi:MAG: HAMP domain-containing protein [Desulfobacterales bacterium]|nr:HAMP domain-containing protein [Desulfobacterales bacterium]